MYPRRKLDDHECWYIMYRERALSNSGGTKYVGSKRSHCSRTRVNFQGFSPTSVRNCLVYNSYILGALLSAFLAPPSLLFASGAAFLLSELADCAIYTPLQRKRFVLAVVASGAIGIVVDSALFLHLAFGNMEFLIPQIIGKAWVIALAVPIIVWLRARDRKLGLKPA